MCVILVFFFFFKQKTAYEMRISDWSSDVCSSDLGQFIGGWLHTGDMGWRDEQGNLFIGGRSKDLIIYKGYNVYPQPLEELVCSHPDVLQAAVVGAPRSEDRRVGKDGGSNCRLR